MIPGNTLGTKGAGIQGNTLGTKFGGSLPEKPLAPEGQLRTLDGKPINGKKYRVTVFATESDKTDVVMAVNGFAIAVQRNKEVILDECFVEVLRNSMIQTTEQDPDSGLSTPITRMTFPHQAIPI